MSPPDANPRSMEGRLKKRIGILTGGGDVAPLNAVIHSAFEHGKPCGIEVVGIARGWLGLLERHAVDLRMLTLDPRIGGTVLRSSRINLAAVVDAHSKAEASLRAIKLDGLIIIGGDDTLSNAFHLKDIPQVLISKTIDNDVGVNEPGRIVNYFTLGYPTAAEKISSFVSLKDGLRTTAYSHERILVVESMGMHAGWLALASAMGHPDFIIIPEFPLDYEMFKELVIERYRKERNVVIVVSEGASWKDKGYISADESDGDEFGHPKFKGAAEALTARLKADLKQYFDSRNVNAVNPSYLYRSGRPNELDYSSAVLLGKEAVKLFMNGMSEPNFLTLRSTGHGFETECVPLKTLRGIQEFHRFVDNRYYDAETFQVTPEGKDYLKRIIPEMSDADYGWQ